MYKAATLALALFAGASMASTIDYDQNVTSNVIFGSGNANGGFTTSRGDGLEIGIRGKLRFDSNNSPQNIYNSNGDGSYTFNAGNPPTGFGFDPNNPTTPVWNFDWSINTDFDGSSGKTLSDYTYQLGMDADAGAGTNFMTFDLITPGSFAPYFDHAFGDSSTGANAGTTGTAVNYGGLYASSSMAQNSWNYEFFNDASPLSSFDPTVNGEYEIYIAVFEGMTEVGRSSITISVVPAPGAFACLGMGGLVAMRRRRA